MLIFLFFISWSFLEEGGSAAFRDFFCACFVERIAEKKSLGRGDNFDIVELLLRISLVSPPHLEQFFFSLF